MSIELGSQQDRRSVRVVLISLVCSVTARPLDRVDSTIAKNRTKICGGKRGNGGKGGTE